MSLPLPTLLSKRGLDAVEPDDPETLGLSPKRFKYQHGSAASPISLDDSEPPCPDLSKERLLATELSQTKPTPPSPKELAQQQKELDKQRKELERMKKQQLRESAKLEKERERMAKQAQKEAEKKAREEQKERERQEKLKAKEEAKLQREREKEEAKLAKQAKLQQEREEKQRQKEEQKRQKEEEKQEKARAKEEAERLQAKEEAEKKKQRRMSLLSQIGLVPRQQSQDLLSVIQTPRRTIQVIPQATGSLVLAPNLPPREVSSQEIDEQLQRPWTMEEIQAEFQRRYRRECFPVPQRKPLALRKEHPHLSGLKAMYFGTRPPTYSTFSKTSRIIRPRQPFLKDETMLDYEMDSEDEWEEGEGEDLANASDEEDMEIKDDEEYDEFLVPDGYLSDEEGLGDSSLTHNHRRTATTKPECCFFLSSSADHNSIASTLNSYPVLPLCGQTFPIAIESLKSSKSKSDRRVQAFNDAALPDLVQALHNSRDGVVKIVTCLKTKYPEISKRQIERKIKEISKKENGVWNILDSSLVEKYCPSQENISPPNTTKEVEVRVLQPKRKKSVPIARTTNSTPSVVQENASAMDVSA